MEPIKVTVSGRGYIVLPAMVRKKLEIRPGTQMLLRREKNKLTLEPITSFTDKLDGLTLQSIGTTAKEVDNHIDAERAD